MSKNKQNNEDVGGELKKRKRDDNKKSTEKDQEAPKDKEVKAIEKSPKKEKKEEQKEEQKEKEQKGKKQKKDDESASNTQAGNNNNSGNSHQPGKQTVVLGGLHFSLHENGVYNHASRILNDTRVGFKLNEKDKAFVVDLLRLGHENFAKKAGAGIADIKVAMHSEHTLNKCFFVVRVDGTEEDFSYLKCVKSIFPMTISKKKQKNEKDKGKEKKKGPLGITKYNKNKNKNKNKNEKKKKQKKH